jgi:hypothetical protein
MTISRSLEAGALAIAFLGACSSFEADPRSPSDAGALDAGVRPDASSTSADSGDVCGGLPLEPFATLDLPSRWVQQGTNSPGTIGVSAAPYFAAQGNYLHASVTNATVVSEPPTLISPSIAVAKHVRLEYDLAVEKAEHYGELGCELEIWGPTADEDLVVLYVGVERNTGASLIAGWNYRAASAGEQSDETALLAGWQSGKWQHVVMDVTIDASQVSAQVSIGAAEATTIQPPNATYSFKELHVRCGILYLAPMPDGVEQTMDVGIDDIAVSECERP